MTGDLVPSELSDADRERAVEQLHRLIEAGQLSLEEFEQRLEPVLRAQSRDEMARLLADATPEYAGRDEVQLKVSSGTIKRRGQWLPARRMTVEVGSGTAKLDFTEALVTEPVVNVVVTLRSGTVKLVLPERATADIDEVAVKSGTAKSRVPAVPVPGRLHVHIVGSVKSGSLKVRYQRRFWRWRW
ncbi:MAG: DUF1707 SHOCT-like domain-containing protein [Micromonosporaceae bacterium]